jgi:pimeloyl-ACP methyl ester carboxylesterase
LQETPVAIASTSRKVSALDEPVAGTGPAAETQADDGVQGFARPFCWLATALILFVAGGCASDPNKPFTTSDRMDSGLVIILPGIEGESSLNHDVRRGLLNGGLFYAMPIYRWGRPIPIAGPLLNQIDILGNRIEGKEIANRIVSYQKSYPGRPVYLIGHSGGGGIAVFAAEALPKDVSIDGLVLLSASISSAYDLTNALGHCRKGILNIHSRADIGLLIIGTMLAGNVDGIRGPAAGAIGFDRPTAKSSPQRIQAYQKLYQLELTGPLGNGSSGAHASTTRSSFITHYVLPWLMAASWPPPNLPGVATAEPTSTNALAAADP